MQVNYDENFRSLEMLLINKFRQQLTDSGNSMPISRVRLEWPEKKVFCYNGTSR